MALLEKSPRASTDLDFYYGTALAHLQRWQDAHDAFAAGARKRPEEKRFPLELAGVEFKQKRYARAAAYLRRALRIDPNDEYGNEFLATVYFLQGNTEAALKYWARIGKPKITEVRAEPTPRLRPALLDYTFAFAPASILRAPDLLTSEVRVRGLGIFPTAQFDLQAREDGTFDVVFRNRERNGWGRTKLEKLFLLLGGLPFQTVTPEFFNLHGGAMNITSLFRWDAEKRRVTGRISAPFHQDPKYRYGFFLDLRSENWDVRNASSTLASTNLRREAVGAEFTDFVSGRWQWSANVELSHRDFRSVAAGTVLTPELLAKGYQLKQTMKLNADLWRWPERRMTLAASASSEAGRLWSGQGEGFEKGQGGLRLQWFPKAEGDDYEVQQQIRVGKTFGDVPFDELFMLGVERDNDLLMRAHIGTHHGRKGNAPLGKNYFLSNWEVDKNVYSNGFLNVKVGPFLDTGKVLGGGALGPQKWLWDTGAQAKIRVFGVGVVFSYGKDLRSGNNAFYVSTLR